MRETRLARIEDVNNLILLDQHLSKDQLIQKVKNQEVLLLIVSETIVGILRFNFFWDTIPFCNLIYLTEEVRRMGCGTKLLAEWECLMKENGYDVVMTSTQSDESAQHFYRAHGYKDCGSLLLPVEGYQQPLEILFIKNLS